MIRSVSTGALGIPLAITVGLAAGVSVDCRAQEQTGRDIPPAFAAFEYLVGQWTGQAMPKDTAQSFRGWPETHSWAWTFTKGQPTGMTVAIEGGKVLAEGKLSFDAPRKRYRLEGTTPKPEGRPIAFEGALDGSGKLLVLDQVSTGKGGGAAAGQGTIRLSIRPNSNFIRYTMGFDRREPGAVQFSRSIEVGLTKRGESLAGGSTSSDRPKCIVTGGAATMTLSYNGQSFAICCTGCRDEFNENPEKYIKKAALMAQSRGPATKSAPARVGRFEDAFSGDVADAPATKMVGRSARTQAPAGKASKAGEDANRPADADEPAAASKTKAAGKGELKAVATTPAARAAGLLRIARNLEKSGKTDAALKDYKRIVKDFAGTPAARTAKERIEAIEKR
jgi:hypothetical protein